MLFLGVFDFTNRTSAFFPFLPSLEVLTLSAKPGSILFKQFLVCTFSLTNEGLLVFGVITTAKQFPAAPIYFALYGRSEKLRAQSIHFVLFKAGLALVVVASDDPDSREREEVFHFHKHRIISAVRHPKNAEDQPHKKSLFSLVTHLLRRSPRQLLQDSRWRGPCNVKLKRVRLQELAPRPISIVRGFYFVTSHRALFLAPPFQHPDRVVRRGDFHLVFTLML